MHISIIHRLVYGIVAATVISLGTAVSAQGVQGFGVPERRFPLRGFGNPTGEESLIRRFPELAFGVTENDRQQARFEIAKTDGNFDGIVTEREWADSGYQSVDRFKLNDLDGDGKLTLFEHSLRWAQYRIGKVQQRQAERTPEQSRRGSPLPIDQHPGSRQDATRERHIEELAAYAFSVYDRDRSGLIERSEFRLADSPFGDVAPSDSNRNGQVTQAELFNWLQRRRLSQSDSELPAGTPTWFITSDIDNDGQVEMAEFLQFQPHDKISDFERADRNRDGIVTTKELVSLVGTSTQRFSSNRLHFIEAERQTYAQLVVTESMTIADIDVQLSLTKDGHDDVELELISPNGMRAALYFDSRNKPWSGGPLFNNTVIDDEAPEYPQRLARPPLTQTFRPQSMKVNGLNSLQVFYGTQARGSWRLAVRNTSQVSGILEGWALLITPREKR